jgi:uncharacterized membrane protein YkvA (DUF1232 family)
VPLKVTFELSDKDLLHFKQVMKEARSKARARPETKLMKSAKELLEHVREAEMPVFVRDRLLQLGIMIEMLEDSEWALEGQDRERITSALAYFDEPLDLIPDHVPGFGFLDDAIMVELVARELKHDIEAFRDFREYRKAEEKRRGRSDDDVTRAEWLGSKRKQLHQRMRRRRKARGRSSSRSGSSRSPFSLW